MARKFDSDTLVLATHNKGKIVEIADLLSPYVDNFKSAGELGLPEPEETGTTFEANAIIKAQEIAQGSGQIALADDSGLSVNALGGDPGVYSARWAGPEKNFDMAMQKINDMLGDNADRSAAFVSVLALAWPDGHVETVEGRCEGKIIWPPRGDGGFGYDPMFIPDGHEQTFAEMNLKQKQSLSHRARAFSKLVQLCFI